MKRGANLRAMATLAVLVLATSGCGRGGAGDTATATPPGTLVPPSIPGLVARGSRGRRQSDEQERVRGA